MWIIHIANIGQEFVLEKIRHPKKKRTIFKC